MNESYTVESEQQYAEDVASYKFRRFLVGTNVYYQWRVTENASYSPYGVIAGSSIRLYEDMLVSYVPSSPTDTPPTYGSVS